MNSSSMKERVKRELQADVRATIIAALVLIGWLAVASIIAGNSGNQPHTEQGEPQ